MIFRIFDSVVVAVTTPYSQDWSILVNHKQISVLRLFGFTGSETEEGLK